MNEGRRNFLKNTGLVGAGLAIGVSLGKGNILFPAHTIQEEFTLTPFILIQRSGKVTLINPNPDMGQGSRQAVPTLIAEELEILPEDITIMQSDGHSKYGVQISGGSGSVRRGWEPLRKAGAAAKEMLIKAAATRWKTDVANCYAENGTVINRKTNVAIHYGDLVEDASAFEIPQHPVLKKPEEFKLIGKPLKHPDAVGKVTGRAVYGIDVEIPGMVVASILHSPTIHDKIIAIDDTETRRIPGVIDVVKCERPMPHRRSEAVAVIATNFWTALKGRKALKVRWEQADHDCDTDRYIKKMHDAIADPGLAHAQKGNFTERFQQATNKLEAIYETPFLAHVPIEPENATVHVKSDGTVEVWAPLQAPDWARSDIAKYMGIIPEKIKVNITLLGGSFGRKAYHDFLLEACYLSRHVGKPVKVIWSREDDVTQGPYRPALLSHFMGVFNNKKITGLHHHAIGESIDGQVHNNLTPGVADPILCGEIDFENSKYTLDFSQISYTRVETEIPVVWWRSVYASNFAWAQECFIDELAHLAGLDPLQARLDLLTDERFRKVLTLLAEKSGYSDAPAKGTARGIAIWKSFESISAACVLVSQEEDEIKIRKVFSVIDCGIYVNPDMVRAQTEGNIIMGLGAAIKDGITLKNGVCDQTNFHQYQIMRMHEIPDMEVHIMQNTFPPGGVGEPGLPPIAPALGNAIFNLTGKRIRKLPLSLIS